MRFWLLLLVMWLLLNQTLSVGHVLLGAALALGALLAFAALQAPASRARRPVLILELAWLAVSDMVRSNIAVARIVLHRGTPHQTSAFVSIPLELRDPGGLAVLACILTATPGTAWARYDVARNILTLHLLDVIDEEAWIRTVKQRYERRLLQIFQ